MERVWDQYLSEHDKTHINASGHKLRGFGARPALLMIDLYRWVFGDKPLPLIEAMDEWPGSCGLAAWDSLPYIQKLLATAREVGIPVVHVTGLPERESGVLDGLESLVLVKGAQAIWETETKLARISTT